MFITLEGPEGGGKTTHLQPLAEFLRAQGYSVITTREPGGTPVGDQVRQILTSLDNTDMHQRTETLLFLAARAQLVEQCIRPQLANGRVVLCDRYADSTLAYQGYGHGNDLATIRRLLDFATGELWPDLTFLFDLDPEQGLQRKRKEGEWNRLEEYSLAFHRRVWKGYQALAQQQPARWVVIDASQPVETVFEQLCRITLARLQAAGRQP